MNRIKLSAHLAHQERGLEHALRPPRPRPAPPALPPRPTPELPEPTALKTAAARARRPKPHTIVFAPKTPPGAVRLTAPALKVILPLDPAAVGAIVLPDGQPAPPFVVDVGDRTVTAQLSAKSLKKILALIAEHGPEKMSIALQGKLTKDDALAEAGLAALVRKPKGGE